MQLNFYEWEAFIAALEAPPAWVVGSVSLGSLLLPPGLLAPGPSLDGATEEQAQGLTPEQSLWTGFTTVPVHEVAFYCKG